MLAMRKGMKRAGADAREILITGENEIVDGRHWFWNAKALQWDKVRVRVIGAHEVHAAIRETLTNRRHYSKGQLAFLIAPMMDEEFAEAHKRRALNAAKAETNSVRDDLETPASIAATMGITVRVLQQAREIHEFFADKTKRTMTDRDGVTEKGVTFKEFFEPRILLEEDPEAPRTRAYGLGAVLAGIKASIKMNEKDAPHGGGRPQNVQKQLDLFEDSFKGVSAKFSYWQKWEPETRQAAMAALPPVVEKMPDDLLAEFAKVVKTEMKRREK